MAVDRATARLVRERAAGFCEYCRLPEAALSVPHVIDHVIAQQHGGADVPDNLALACGRCNAHKGPNLSGIDRTDSIIVTLFNPRRQQWGRHFRFDGPVVVGESRAGRATVLTLAMNGGNRVRLRQLLLTEGLTLGP